MQGTPRIDGEESDNLSKGYIELKQAIAKQIDWYFSDTNLQKDCFLLQQMDDFGGVAVSMIANFPKMSQWTGNITLMMEAVEEFSSLVQVDWAHRTLRRMDFADYYSPQAHSVVKIFILDNGPLLELVASCLLCFGLWNSVVFSVFDVVGNYLLAFRSEFHARAAQYHLMRTTSITVDQLILCSPYEMIMGCIPLEFRSCQEKNSSFLNDYSDSCTHFQPEAQVTIWKHEQHVVDTMSPFHPMDNPILTNMADRNHSLLEKSLHRQRERKRKENKPSNGKRDKANGESKSVQVVHPKYQKKDNRSNKKKKNEESNHQSHKHFKSTLFEWNVQDFPPLSDKKVKSSSCVSTTETTSKEKTWVRGGCLDSKEQLQLSSKDNGRIEKSYASVAATFPSPNTIAFTKAPPLKTLKTSNLKDKRRKGESKVPFALSSFTRRESKQSLNRNPKRNATRSNKKEQVDTQDFSKKPLEEEKMGNESIDRETLGTEWLHQEDRKDEFIRREEKNEIDFNDKAVGSNPIEEEKVVDKESKGIEMFDNITLEENIEDMPDNHNNNHIPNQNDHETDSDNLYIESVFGHWQLVTAKESEPVTIDNVICDEALSISQVLENLHMGVDAICHEDTELTTTNQDKISFSEDSVSLEENNDSIHKYSILMNSEDCLLNEYSSVSNDTYNLYRRDMVSSQSSELLMVKYWNNSFHPLEGLKFFSRGLSS